LKEPTDESGRWVSSTGEAANSATKGGKEGKEPTGGELWIFRDIAFQVCGAA